MRLVLISLDAVARPDADRLLRLPALSALLANGVFCRAVRTVYPTLTYPIHTSIITGCYPDRHGVGHNQPFQPDTPPDKRVWYWDSHQIRQKTLWRAACEKGMDAASILWPVSGKNHDIRRNFPEVLPLPGENATLKMLRYATPGWVLRMELLYGRRRASIQQPDLDDYAALLCEKLILSRRPPDMLTVHLVDCDAMRHRFGTDSDEAHAAMARLDGRVQRIMNAVKAAGLMEETVFCVVSDHGQEDARNEIPLDSLLKGKIPSRAQSLGLGAYLRGGDLNKARELLTSHKAQWHISQIFTDACLRALHAPKDVHLAVDAQAGWRFTDGQNEEEHLGDHGFSLDHQGARTLLWLSGGPFKKGVELNECAIVDVAPTLAKAFDLSLPDTDGQPISEAFIRR